MIDRVLRYMKHQWIILLGACFSFLIPLSTYMLTLAPTVTFGDSGELITAAYSLGISHPPGSPLWTLIAHLFTYLPINSIAWRVNFSSAFFAASTGLVLFFIISQSLAHRKKSLHSWQTTSIALCSSLIFSFSQSFWRSAVIAEVYTLNAFIFSLILLCISLWCLHRKLRYLLYSSCLLGLGLANHYIFFLVVPVCGIWLLLAERRILFSRKLLLLTVAFLLGLSVYVYIPLRARAHPVINWGNPETLERFWVYLQRKEFSANLLNNNIDVGVALPIGPITSISQLGQRSIKAITYFSISSWRDQISALFLFFFIGCIYLFKSRKKGHAELSWIQFLGLLFLSTGLGYAFLINSTYIPIEADFPEYFFSFIIMSAIAGYGLYWIAIFLHTHKHSVLLRGALLGIFIIPVTEIMTHYPQNDWSRHRVAYDHAINILNSAKSDAIIFSGKNLWTFPLLYVTAVEHQRPDITIYDRSGNLFEPIYQQNTRVILNKDDFEGQRQEVENKIIAKNPSRPVYYATDKDFENYPHETETEGILYRTKTTPSQPVKFQQAYQNMLSITNNSWKDDDTSYMLSYYHLRLGDFLAGQGDSAESKKEYENALQFGYYHQVALNNVATIYATSDQPDQAAELYKRVISLDPSNLTARNNLAALYEKTGKDQDAIDAYRAIVKQNASNTEARMHLASLLESAKQYEDALKEYEALLPLIPDKKPALERIAKVSFELGNCDKGQEIVNDNEKPTNLPVVYNNLGVCWARKNQLDKAKTAWEKAVELDETYQEPKDNLLRLEKLPPPIM